MMEKHESIPQTSHEILEQRLEKLRDPTKSVETIIEEFIEKLKQENTMEAHIKFIFTIPNGIEDVFTKPGHEEIPFLSDEEKEVNKIITKELNDIKEDLKKYEIGNPDQEQEILDKFGERCLQARINHSSQVIRLLHNFLNRMLESGKELSDKIQ